MPSRPVDEKIAKLTLDSDSFKKKATEAIKCISDLNKKFDSVNSVKMDNIEKSVDSIANRFTLLGNIVQNVFGRIANSVVSIGTNIFRALNITPLLQGYSEYELKLNSIQTIMVNTGESIDTVSAALNELNKYADQTIYSFSDMTRNIGLFTAAGVDLQTSISSIKGLANLAAGMGVSNTEAARATWQLSQALASGYVRLQDWMSVEYAGLGGQYFQKALVEHANKVGTLSMSYEELTKKYGSFRNSLTEGAWLTSDVLSSTLEQFANDQTLIEAATKVKSFSQLMGTSTEALGSGWAQTWEILFGNIEEAKEFWTPISDAIVDFVTKSSDARNKFVQEWKDLGGFDSLVKGLANTLKILQNVMEPIGEAFDKLIPDITPKKLADMTKSFEEFTAALANKDFSVISKIFDKIASSVDKVKSAFKQLLGAFNLDNLLTLGGLGAGVFVLDRVGGLINSLKALIKNIQSIFTDNPIKKLANSFDDLKESLHGFVYGVNPFTLAATGFALYEIASALEILAGLNMDGAVQGLVILGLALTEVNVIMGYLKPGQFKSGGTMVLMATTLKIIAGVMNDLAKIDMKSALKSISIMGLVLMEFTWAMDRMLPYEDSYTILPLVFAVKIISGVIEDLAQIKASSALKSVIIIGMVLTELGLAMRYTDPGIFNAGQMLSLSVSLGIIAGVIDKISQIKATSAVKAVGIIGIVLTELAIATSKVRTYRIDPASLLSLSVSLGIISLVIDKISQIKATSALKSVGVIGIVLAELTIAMRYMNSMPTGGGTMVLMASSLLVLSGALKILSSIPFESLSSSVIILSAFLASLAIATNMLQGSLVGGATFVLIAAGLTVLSTALKLLSTIPIDGVASALLLVGGSLGALVLASYGLSGALPGLLGLAGVLLSFAAASAGIGLAAAGIGTLMEAITGFIKLVNNEDINIDFSGMFESLFTGIIENTPKAIEALVGFISSLLLAIAEAIPQFTDSGIKMIVAFMQGMADAISTNSEPLVQSFYNLLGALIQLLWEIVKEGFERLITWITSDGVQSAINSGIQWVQGLISGIASWIGNVIQSGVDTVLGFINGLLSIPGQIIQAGVDAVTNFVNGIKSWFGNLFGAGADSAKEAKSGMESVDATSAGSNFVQGFINGMGSLAGSLWDTAVGLAQSAWNALTSTLQERSPSRLTTKGGMYFTQGFINGISSLTNKAKMASKNVARNALSGLATLYDEAPNDDFNFTPTITPIWDLSGFEELESLLYKYNMSSMDVQLQNGSDGKIVKTLEAIKNKLDAMIDKVEDLELKVSVVSELDGEILTDKIDEIHYIRDLLDKIGKGE